MAKAWGELFAPGTVIPAGRNKATAIVSNVLDFRNRSSGGLIDWRITNSGALGAPCIIMFQTSRDGSNWFDYYPVAGSDLLTGTVTEGPSVPASAHSTYLRALAYGNTNNACAAEAGVEYLEA